MACSNDGFKGCLGLFGLYKNSLRPFLLPNCGRFCGLIVSVYGMFKMLGSYCKLSIHT